jgi:hypothetical protein
MGYVRSTRLQHGAWVTSDSGESHQHDSGSSGFSDAGRHGYTKRTIKHLNNALLISFTEPLVLRLYFRDSPYTISTQ